MKKPLLLITALLGLTIVTFAGPNQKKTAALEKNISTSIKNQISYPEFLLGQGGEHNAIIFFNVTECGTIIIKDITCNNPELITNLLNQAQNIKINGAGLDPRDTYKVVVRFETLN